ncbi:MAG: hypothetical protein A2Z88_11505 [Omnitrophica WOR_2 bacterium GWA2_47_8]|nr:MAG: hypothetical protein A2Z88_11505 [Omnitrophica WOR_2 bacterium GWA2_47_8]
MQKKETTQLIITIVLGVVLVLVLAKNLTKKKAVPVTGAPAQGVSAGRSFQEILNDQSRPREGDGLYSKLQEENQRSEFKRDPFSKVPIVSEDKPAVLYLKGIMQDGPNYIAIINDDIVSIGAKVGGNTVVEILKDRVILNDGTNNFELRIEEK